MKKASRKTQTLLFVLAAAVLIVVLIGLLAAAGARRSVHTGITLPEQGSVPREPEISADPVEGFLSVTPENAPAVAATLSRPEAYHQILEAKFSSGTVQGVQTVELWVRGSVRRISVTENGETRCILTDGRAAYVWYADSPLRIEAVTLPEGVSADDLSGILTYETVVALPPDRMVEASYLQLAELSQRPCLYLCASQENDADLRCWVDLSTGLLCKAGIGSADDLRYELTQTGLEIVQYSDENLATQLLLPNGVRPFAPTASE